MIVDSCHVSLEYIELTATRIEQIWSLGHFLLVSQKRVKVHEFICSWNTLIV